MGKITSPKMMKTFTIFMALAAIAAVAVADEKADLLSDILTGPVPESALELADQHDLSEHVDRNNDNCGGKRHFGWSNCALQPRPLQLSRRPSPVPLRRLQRVVRPQPGLRPRMLGLPVPQVLLRPLNYRRA